MCLHSMSIWSILHALVIMTVPFTDNSLCVHLTKSYTYGLLLKNVNREQMIIKWFQTLALLQWEREKKNLIFILLFCKFYFWGVCFKKKDTVYWCQHTINHLHTLWPKSASTHPPRHTIKKSVYTHPSMHTMGLPKSTYMHPSGHTITKASTDQSRHTLTKVSTHSTIHTHHGITKVNIHSPIWTYHYQSQHTDTNPDIPLKKSVCTHPSMHTMGLPKSAYIHPPRHTITKASTQSPIQTYH